MRMPIIVSTEDTDQPCAICAVGQGDECPCAKARPSWLARQLDTITPEQALIVVFIGCLLVWGLAVLAAFA